MMKHGNQVHKDSIRYCRRGRNKESPISVGCFIDCISRMLHRLYQSIVSDQSK
jgi:hypothetical protein